MSYRQTSSTEALRTLSIPWTTMDRPSQKMIRVVIPLGCMSSAAIASPILFEYRKLWLITVLVFFLSTGVFMTQYPEEMKTYGPFTLVFATFLGFASYSSARTPLPDLIPWIPMVVWLFVSLTVYFLPKAHELFTRPMSLQDAAEQGRNYHLQRYPRENIRAQPATSMHPRNENMELNDWLRGMDRRSVTGLPDDLSTRESDIDLQENSEAMRIALRRAVSFGHAGFFTNGLSQSSSDEPYPQNPAAGVHSGHLQNPGDGFDPDSTVGSASSTTAASMMPLLG